MKRRPSLVVTLVLVTMIIATAHLFAASMVRGKLIRRGARGEYPAAGVGVTVLALSSGIGRSPMSYSAGDGMYYIPNVPGGQYRLEIWASDPPATYDIVVDDARAYTDIAPSVIP